jgi:hypothetical protein
MSFWLLEKTCMNIKSIKRIKVAVRINMNVFVKAIAELLQLAKFFFPMKVMISKKQTPSSPRSERQSVIKVKSCNALLRMLLVAPDISNEI